MFQAQLGEGFLSHSQAATISIQSWSVGGMVDLIELSNSCIGTQQVFFGILGSLSMTALSRTFYNSAQDSVGLTEWAV